MDQGGDQGRQGWKRVALGLLVLLALGEFTARGPVRALRHTDFNDFISPYMQTKAWLRGEDPYDPLVVAKLWPAEVETPSYLLPQNLDTTVPARHGIPSPYPLTAFPLLIPFALVNWPVAILLWTGLNLISFVVAVRFLLTLARIEGRRTEALLVVLAALAFAPFHTAIAAANMVLVVLALGMLAARNVERDRHLAAGLLLAAAAALKPTAALCFILYAAARGRWRSVAIAAAAGAVLFSIADLRLWFAGAHWMGSCLLNAQRMFAAGAIDDFTPANAARFDLLNLQLVVFQLLGNKFWTEIVSGIVVGGLLGFWALAWRKQRAPEDGLLDLATLATLSLLPFYHRFTDGGLLLPCVVWSIREFKRSRRSLAGAVLILAAPFLVPGAAALQVLAASNPTAGELSGSWWWQFLLAPHQVWMILTMSVLLLVARWTITPSRAGA